MSYHSDSLFLLEEVRPRFARVAAQDIDVTSDGVDTSLRESFLFPLEMIGDRDRLQLVYFFLQLFSKVLFKQKF